MKTFLILPQSKNDINMPLVLQEESSQANTAPVWSNAGPDFRNGVNLLLIALPFGDQ
ncbi:hypothetical protein J7E52_02245 [Bacillus sp. ISL-34]|uniref:hypothetical protein n=1 Tax=Bacillus sp. ISL-34 TaxID=2819121 RepID=UPI001BEA7C71|nr:hypothetical protein [Bacillus sp. ISL-34]MBT2645551.1 hypothetical protein [Bacillus sp. ISL-34]